ncbi:hypothetical protein BpHYR1_049960 [Brachionus plicatilis]|uniref:Uncharacterized protein n=1 Tax=Brachionus plicatilis TaxID=10195 RepID=A0A3M7RMY6_BRAPC|nr:hypothetical protein BpHYR1_049960 [Brachionus plicatilis]
MSNDELTEFNNIENTSYSNILVNLLRPSLVYFECCLTQVFLWEGINPIVENPTINRRFIV